MNQPVARTHQNSSWLSVLGVRPEETAVISLLFGNMFISGIAIGMLRVAAFTLFLAEFTAEQLAIMAILLAFTGTVLTLLISKITHGRSFSTYVFTVLGTILVGLLGYWFLLGTVDNKIFIFALPLFFETVYMLFSLQFVTLLSRLLDVRQTKRLSGIARSGEFLAEMVGGISVALLLAFMQVQDLLLVAAGATAVVFIIAELTARKFKAPLAVTSGDLVEEEEIDNKLLRLLRLPYVRSISLCYAAYIFAYFFLDVAFYHYASKQFTDEVALATFLGQFIAISGFITLLVMVFLFAPVLRRFGVLAGVIGFPIVIAIGATAVSAMEFAGVAGIAIFFVMVATNGMRFVLQSAMWRPSVTILFQVLPDRQRTQGTSLIEGVIDPLSGGLAGLTLFIISHYLQWEPQMFLLVLTGLMVFWISMGVAIRQMYLSNLVVSIQKRKIGELSVQELDNASLDIIKSGIESDYPAEVFYCMNLLEEMEHPEITELLKEVMTNDSYEVRLDTLERVARLQIDALQSQVSERIDTETHPRVLGQALITYGALGADDVSDVLTPHIDSDQEFIRRGALTGLLNYAPASDDAKNKLLELARSEDPDQRMYAADVMGDFDAGASYLVELLDDDDSAVVSRAIHAAGLIRDARLINTLVGKLSVPGLQGPAAQALQQFGDDALYDLDLGFRSPEATRQVKRQIIEIVREIGGTGAMEILLRHIEIDHPELRHQIYLALATLNYQADPDDQYIFVNKLEEEVELITWLLASMEDIFKHRRYRALTAALGQELDTRRDNMLLIMSFIFPSIVMLDTRASIASKVSELRVFALEVLDNLLTNEIKPVVLPILDDLSVSERLAQLDERFPQVHMNPQDRFEDLVSRHFEESFVWTKASLLHQIGNDKHEHLLDAVRSGLEDSEPLVRETAAWSLVQLEIEDAPQILAGHKADPSPHVREVVGELLEGLG
ncbi:MAG: Npt1/Npt2 family nucleotide transporter [Pseudomonadota bacterium]